MSEMPDKVWIHDVGLDGGCSYVTGVFDPDDREPGDIEYLHNPYGDDGVVVEKESVPHLREIDPETGALVLVHPCVWRGDPDQGGYGWIDDRASETLDALESKLAEAEAVIEWWGNLVKRNNIGTPGHPSSLKEYVEQAEAVIAKLPRTADGVVVVPGMTVYHYGRSLQEAKKGQESRVVSGVVDLPMHPVVRSCPSEDGIILGRSAEDCYSTPEAAKEARDVADR